MSQHTFLGLLDKLENILEKCVTGFYILSGESIIFLKSVKTAFDGTPNDTHLSQGSVDFWWPLFVPEAHGVNQPEEIVPFGAGDCFLRRWNGLFRNRNMHHVGFFSKQLPVAKASGWLASSWAICLQRTAADFCPLTFWRQDPVLELEPIFQKITKSEPCIFMILKMIVMTEILDGLFFKG